VPFGDEVSDGVVVCDYTSAWPVEFDLIAAQLDDALGTHAIAIDHIGSTSVPGLAAKDCVDVQVRVRSLDDEPIAARMSAIGFRCRPEPWNKTETSFGRECGKLVFAPPVGARRSNVHVRVIGGPNIRYALLFRDYLRSDEGARNGWAAFKRRLAQSVPDLLDYGQIKAPATEVLMTGAARWAAETGWSVP
jgi:dephospho-CoA kinase